MARRTHSAEFKLQVVLEVISGARSQAELAREHHLKPDLIRRWTKKFLENAPSVFEQRGPDQAARARIAELERALGRKTMELEIAKKHPASWGD